MGANASPAAKHVAAPEAGSGADSDTGSAVGSDTGGWAGGVIGSFDRLMNFNHIELALPETRPQCRIEFQKLKNAN